MHNISPSRDQTEQNTRVSNRFLTFFCLPFFSLFYLQFFFLFLLEFFLILSSLFLFFNILIFSSTFSVFYLGFIGCFVLIFCVSCRQVFGRILIPCRSDSDSVAFFSYWGSIMAPKIKHFGSSIYLFSTFYISCIKHVYNIHRNRSFLSSYFVFIHIYNISTFCV